MGEYLGMAGHSVNRATTRKLGAGPGLGHPGLDCGTPSEVMLLLLVMRHRCFVSINFNQAEPCGVVLGLYDIKTRNIWLANRISRVFKRCCLELLDKVWKNMNINLNEDIIRFD